MKKILFLLAFLSLFSAQAQFGNQSQIFDPVTWEASVEQQNDSIYTLVFKAELEPGWHLPSQREETAGPLPTVFEYDSTATHFQLIGKTSEPEGIVAVSPIFDVELKSFEEEAVFRQKIKVSDKIKPIELKVYFMVCNDQRCLPPDSETFTINLAKTGDAAVQTGFTGELTEKDRAMTEALRIDLKGKADFNLEKKEKDGMWTIFFLGFIGGLIALLTPCVFPMIPLTVSFFTKGAKDRKKGLMNAILYGFFIFAIYLLLSVPFHLLDSISPNILNNISTNTWLNVAFFVIFIVFAISFFGYFEITLPSSWSNKMDEKATSFGGAIGIFFMALTLALVSFSCTGPILGTLLGSSLTTDGGAMQLSVGMGGFGLALALPFALFALFPNWLNSLPKSGGWLNTVKVVLGFIELALAFKFLSNADLVNQWGLLQREVFIAIWIVIGIGLALYLFGLVRFPHDGPKQKLSWTRKILGVITVLFVLYLIPGLTNTKYANLKLISGFPPPLFYSIYDKGEEGLLGLEIYHDFEKGMAAAEAAGKPVMLDFTGWACVNCRKMEENVWSVPKVHETLKNDYVIISLYVDDDNELPEEKQFNYLRANGEVKEIISIGDKWATFQTVNFKNNSQPYYVLLDTDLNLLNKPIGYTPDADEYLAWLKEGLRNFQ
ncbi:MAG TPA: cytochrome c biogenesis protein CcdA [Flavobacteriaceae bacterium]|nr:cytochrome c biogenesis protein CcdA [Flavobacteriaceae bacterium]